MMTRLLRTLNRLRLRLGLFRWKNYARLEFVEVDPPITRYYRSGGNGSTFTVRFGYYRIKWLRGRLEKKRFLWQGDAVDCIRRCVRQGVRP